MIDFQALKQQVEIGEVAIDLLKLDLTPEDGKLRGTCPVCPSPKPRSLLITPEKGLFYCFAKKTGGDVITLTAHVCKASNKEAAAVLDAYVKKQTAAAPAPKQETPPNAQNATLEPLDYLETAHDLLDELGIPENVAEAVGIGYAPKGIMRGTVAIPIRLPTGTLIGYVGITEAKTPKAWRLP